MFSWYKLLTSSITEKARAQDYVELCKPKVVLLMVFCVIVGVCLASPGIVPIDALIFSSVGVGLVASSAAVVNHLADSHIDLKMARTQDRPIATGRISTIEGLLFSAFLGVAGTLILWFLVNPLTAWLNLASWVGYGLVYTFFLKRATPQNIVIGGVFGAAPPLFGWTAVTNTIEPGGLLLVLIIFAWTPPHFWALALDRKEEYSKVGVPMLPVTHGEFYTRLHILLYTLLLTIVSLMPFLIDMSGFIYLIGAFLLAGGFLYFALALLLNKNSKIPMQTFRYSIFYLAALFMFLMVDHYYYLAYPMVA